MKGIHTSAAPTHGAGGWRFWVDRGGTFTDLVARDPSGRIHTHKLLSADPTRYADATLAGIADLLQVPRTAPLPAAWISEVRVGTTVATNALLTRRGARTALVITAGFTDALTIGFQNRPRIFDRQIRRPDPLADRVIAMTERVGAAGQVLCTPDLAALEPQLRRALADGMESVAVVGMHAHRNPVHEQAVAGLAREVGFTEVTCSAQAAPVRKLVTRGGTAVLDAYLSPVLRSYLDEVRRALPGVRVLVMTSHGGLVSADQVRGKDAVLSGPAAGVVGMARSAALAGHPAAIGFDMGGTSTDVCAVAGEIERLTETTVGGFAVAVPMLDIHTVAAGGGSILTVRDARYRVGPASAGADPGPACYGRGGPGTLTDANLVLGRIAPEHFPAVFGVSGREQLDPGAARQALRGVAPQASSVTETAAGFRAVAVATMADAIRRITVGKGRDPAAYTLVAFGGAGGQHACAVADALDVKTVLVPPLAGLLCAVGIGSAALTHRISRAVGRALDGESAALLDDVAADLRVEVAAALAETGSALTTDERVLLRYDGTETPIEVDLGSAAQMTAQFAAAHRRRFSFTLDRPLTVDSVTVTAEAADHDDAALCAPVSAGEPGTRSTVAMYVEGGWTQAALLARSDLGIGDLLPGPAMLTEDGATTIVEPGWVAAALPTGHLELRRTDPPTDPPAAREGSGDTPADPVQLEIFANLFMAIAEQMGARLQATAQSVNIAERLDFSCAVFDSGGHLVANAPHMPVHLGSMGASVAAVRERHGARMRPGDAYALNDPYYGGTHLPDVTVVSPVFASDLELPEPDDRVPEFFVACRGHHAEIGGISPGSMPADSTTLDEEGVRLDAELLVRAGEFDDAGTLALLTAGPYPSRAPQVNLADLRAQVAANAKGIAELARATHRHGLAVVSAYMGHVQDNAADAVRRVIDALSDGHYRYECDSGAVIEVAVRVDRDQRSASIDFTGTSAVLSTNFNAPSSVVTAAVLYVFRTLVDSDIPLNDGCLRPLRIVIPPDTMLSPRYPAAVVAGNVETSQAVTGALYAALGVAAEGSGTMNNVTFGNARAQYYETVASGSGAGPGYAGTPAVQTHMTNSRLTDPEVLEERFPVVVEEFAIRAGSGGEGEFRGGDGARRRLRFTETVTVSLLSSHRRVPPYGMAGGSPGALGRNRLVRADGTVVELAGCDRIEASVGDVLVIETPGGGGFGITPPE